MGVDVIPVGVGCDYDFKAGDMLCQLQGNLMCHLWGDRIVWVEGLHHVVVHSSTGVVMESFRVHEL